MSNTIGLEDLDILNALKAAYAPDHGDEREHNGNAQSLGFGLLHYAFVRNLRPDFALAIGSRYGFIPACIALALKANGKGKVHFVDANYDDQTDHFAKAYGGTAHWNKPKEQLFATLGLHEWIEVFIERTDTFFPRSATKYGYVYIDGNHSYEGVKYDCEQALQHLSPGGLISFHDPLVDQAYVNTLADPGGFGIKDYLKDCYPQALIIHSWPGLAVVQPKGPHLEPAVQAPQPALAAQPTAPAGLEPNPAPSNSPSEAAGADELRERLARQEEQIQSLQRQTEQLARREDELRELLVETRAQLQEQEAYHQLIARLRSMVRDAVPASATVMVVSKGDDQLVSLGAHPGWHFPADATGAYAGVHPADSAEAIAWLEAMRARGGQYLLFPKTSCWWLDSYPEFKAHLERHYRLLAQKADTGLIFALTEPVPTRVQIPA